MKKLLDDGVDVNGLDAIVCIVSALIIIFMGSCIPFVIHNVYSTAKLHYIKQQCLVMILLLKYYFIIDMGQQQT